MKDILEIVVNTTPDLNPENFLKLAENFYNSATVLLKNLNEIRPAPYASIFFCIGHSIELSMKAYLLKTNATEKLLKDLGHNLEYLLEECSKHGLETSYMNKDSISQINIYFSKHDFRYPNMTEMLVPGASEALETAFEFLESAKSA